MLLQTLLVLPELNLVCLPLVLLLELRDDCIFRPTLKYFTDTGAVWETIGDGAGAATVVTSVYPLSILCEMIL